LQAEIATLSIINCFFYFCSAVELFYCLLKTWLEMAACNMPRRIGLISLLCLWASAKAFVPQSSSQLPVRQDPLQASTTAEAQVKEELEIFQRFFNFLMVKQREIIAEIEVIDGSGETFTRDGWGIFTNLKDGDELPKVGAGGITRVLQGGNVVEKGACSLTIIQNGVLSAERAAAIRARQPKDDDEDDDDFLIGAGDFYSAAALSIVLHSRSPMVPTFRSDVRIFLVQDVSSKKENRPVMAWFGGGVSD
jgi:Coproporphyrinogen III oxidase